jgi:hypothetical protein
MTIAKLHVIHLLLVCVAACHATAQSVANATDPHIIAFRWISKPSSQDQERMNTFVRGRGWMIDNNALADRKGIVIIESNERSLLAKVEGFAADITSNFPHRLERLYVDSKNSEIKIFTGDVTVFLAPGTDVGAWSGNAVRKGLTVTQDKDINDPLRVVVRKPHSTFQELKAILAKMPDVQQSEADALFMGPPAINRM